MAKDPAMLWYWADWHSGTSLLSRFLKGCYMDLLNAQFNFGPLSLEEIKTCLGSDFGQAWPTLQKKFKKTENGLFFNERLEEEKIKRKNFCESRRKNKLNKSHDKTSDKHMLQHMENINENENSVYKNVAAENIVFTIEHCLTIAMNDPRWVKANKVLRSDLDKFNKLLEKRGIYQKNPADYKTHFANWNSGGRKMEVESTVVDINRDQKELEKLKELTGNG